jgi:hypothetical protein
MSYVQVLCRGMPQYWVNFVQLIKIMYMAIGGTLSEFHKISNCLYITENIVRDYPMIITVKFAKKQLRYSFSH